MAVFGIDLQGKSPVYGLALGAVLGLILAGAGVWQLTSPTNQKIKKATAELRKKQEQIAEGLAAKQQLPQFREEVQRLELELEKLLRILPARRNTPELLRRIRALAEQGDFDLNVFKPQKTLQKGFYSEWPINVSLAGNYHNLALFFDRVSRFPRIINIENLKIDTIAKQTDERTIRANFITKTFVYSQTDPATEEELASAAAPSGGKKPSSKGKKGRNR